MILHNETENETTVYCDECYYEENFDFTDDPDKISQQLQKLGWVTFHKKIQILICPACMQKKANIL